MYLTSITVVSTGFAGTIYVASQSSLLQTNENDSPLTGASQSTPLIYYNSADLRDLSSIQSHLPPLPHGIGSWESNNYGPWVQENITNESCRSAGNHTPSEGNNYGVEGMCERISNPILEQGIVWVSMSEFSGESDSRCGNNAWSVQLNTNYFTGSNNQQDWIQFVFQNNFHCWWGWHYSWFSIWTNDLSTCQYNRHTISVPVFTLTSSSIIGIVGWVNSKCNLLSASLYLCTSVGNLNVYTVSEKDPYGLSGNWSTVDGTILGIGGRSTANFVSPTCLKTQVTGQAFSTFDGFPGLLYTTGEQNNLNLGSRTESSCWEAYYYTYWESSISSN